MRIQKNRILVAALLVGAAMQVFSQSQPLRVVCIGNSFTYYHDTNKCLEQIAASQGHELTAHASTAGGYSLHLHLSNDKTILNLIDNSYDVAFLQDQSQTPARYAQDTVRCRLLAADAVELAERVRCYSPQVRIFFEHTWGYSAINYGGFGSMTEFDRLLRNGITLYAQKARADVSPIGEAFALVRAEYPTINLYDKDNSHQSPLGSYLKACVNYLLIYKEPFHDEVATCENEPQACAVLQKVAERVVLKGERVIK